METKTRSIVKAGIYRLGSLGVVAGMSFLVTGDVKQTAEISIGYQVVATLIYFAYERIWCRIRWGRKPV